MTFLLLEVTSCSNKNFPSFLEPKIDDTLLHNYCKILTSLGMESVSVRNWNDQNGCHEDLSTLKTKLGSAYRFISSEPLFS